MRSEQESVEKLREHHKQSVEEQIKFAPHLEFMEFHEKEAFRFMINFFIEFKPQNTEQARDLFIKAQNVTGWRQCYGSAVTSERHHRYLGLKDAYEWFIT